MALSVEQGTEQDAWLLRELQEEMPSCAEADTDICLMQGGPGYDVRFSEAEGGTGSIKAEIHFGDAADKNRALFLCAAALVRRKTEGGALPENFAGKRTAADFGVMLDLGRNAVLRVDSIKRLIRTLAFWGYTYVGLYIEDVLQVEGEPYFGYMRGAYSRAEIQEMDAYAASFGMELRPFIETLAHLNQITHYRTYQEAIDVDDILLVGNERAQTLLKNLFASAAKAFRSRTINIGMDEAHQVGLGKYLDQHGYQDRTQIILDHLRFVLSLCREYGFTAQMWSDMFFRLAAHGSYYDGISKEDLEAVPIPDGLGLTYWDYYSLDPERYRRMLRLHKKLTDQVSYAAGAWKWAGFAPRNAFSIAQGKAALEACRDEGIQDIVVTAWGDDGAEASAFSVLPVYFADAGVLYGQNDDAAFAMVTGIPFEMFLRLDEANPYAVDGLTYSNGSKFLLYNDVLQGEFDSLVLPDTAGRFRTAAGRLREVEGKGRYGNLFSTLARLCEVLEIKADLGCRIREAYAGTKSEDEEKRQKGWQMLRTMTDETLPELIKRLKAFWETFRKQWLSENKSFGWEVQDVRLGGLLMRLEDVRRMLEDYQKNPSKTIAELETPQLPFGGVSGVENPDLTNLYYNNWILTVSASRIDF